MQRVLSLKRSTWSTAYLFVYFKYIQKCIVSFLFNSMSMEPIMLLFDVDR